MPVVIDWLEGEVAAYDFGHSQSKVISNVFIYGTDP